MLDFNHSDRSSTTVIDNTYVNDHVSSTTASVVVVLGRRRRHPVHTLKVGFTATTATRYHYTSSPPAGRAAPLKNPKYRLQPKHLIS